MAVAMAIVFTSPAFAYTYGPESEAEWMGWPEFCKVRFTVSDGGRNAGRAGTFPAELVAAWQDKFGDCWGLLHHHCGALLQLQRAKLAVNPSTRRAALDAAVQENDFALTVCPASNPVYAAIITHQGLVFVEGGNATKATQLFDRAIETHPSYAESYIGKSRMLRKKGARAEALAVLEAGSTATSRQSAELENALGLAYVDARQFDKAREAARRAYSLGYPLPALRDRLKQAGYPL
jgi:tetratricopeptide (TPR) repeat protein